MKKARNKKCVKVTLSVCPHFFKARGHLSHFGQFLEWTLCMHDKGVCFSFKEQVRHWQAFIL